MNSRLLTLGVEEEFFAIDPATGSVLPDGRSVLDALPGGTPAGGPSFSDEFRMCMLEGKTPICRTLSEVRAQVGSLRSTLIDAGRRSGVAIAAAGTFPTAGWRNLGITPKSRHRIVTERFRRLAAEHVICACHVHVGVEDRDIAIQVINRKRPWLPVLSALAASSPFWMGEDTGYQSYRAMVWDRWPVAGVPPEWDSWEHYLDYIRLMVETETIVDMGAAYWDIRPGTRFETVELRVADSCTTIDETVLQAALSRALVRTCLDELEAGDPGPGYSRELLRTARWRAARFGLSERLVDPFAGTLVPAGSLLDRLLEHTRPALEEAGDWEEARSLIEAVRSQGTSADRQRAAFASTGRLEAVAELLVEETAGWES